VTVGRHERRDSWNEEEGETYIQGLTFTAVRQARLEVLLRGPPILPFDASAATTYGRIIAQCGWVKGRDFVRMVAAHAISTGSTLVTNNESDFNDIPGLSLENWLL
jgi:tRNA(fMet)-specific endonuclease VapC